MSSVSQEIPRILRHPKLYTALTSLQLAPNLSHSNPVHVSPSHFLKYLILALSVHLRVVLPSSLLPSGLSRKILSAPLLSPTMCHMLHQLLVTQHWKLAVCVYWTVKYSVSHSLPNWLAGGPPHRVATIRRTTDTFLFISHTAKVLLFKFLCNIFIGVRIIKEMPGSVASGSRCINFKDKSG
jgi:hypothetical protein